MTKTLKFAPKFVAAASFALALAACGSATDASEDALADNVEVPADEAMANAPAPVADPDALTEEAPTAEDAATEAADSAEAMVAADAPAAAETPAAAEE
jgi:hypothetical protein